MAVVNEFLAAHGIRAETLSPVGDWLEFSMTVGKANEIFNTTFHQYKHDKTGHTGIRTLSYSVPEALREHIDLIYPMIRFVSEYALIYLCRLTAQT